MRCMRPRYFVFSAFPSFLSIKYVLGGTLHILFGRKGLIMASRLFMPCVIVEGAMCRLVFLVVSSPEYERVFHERGRLQ